MSRVGRQATRPSWISNAPAGQAAKPSPMPAPVVGSPASVSRSLEPLLPPPLPPPPITVAAGITVTPSRSTGSPKTWRALSASRSDLNASCGSTGSVVRGRWSRSCARDRPPTGRSSSLLTRPVRLTLAERSREPQRGDAREPSQAHLDLTARAEAAADTLSADAGPGRHQLRTRTSDARSAAAGSLDQVDEVRKPRHRGRTVQLPAGRNEYMPGDAAAARHCCGASASTSSTPTTGWPAGARSSPGRGRWSSPSTAPTSATASSGRCRGGWPGASTWSPASRGRCSRPRPGGRACRGVPGQRGAALRRRPRPLRADPPRRGPPRARPRARTAATSSSPPTPTRPEKRHDRAAELAAACRRRAADRRRRSSPSGCRSGSTPPTPCSSPPTTRASGSPASRRSPATCRCSRPRSGSRPTRCAGIDGCLCADYDTTTWKQALEPHLEADEPRIDGAARARRFSAGRMAERVVSAYREILGNDAV